MERQSGEGDANDSLRDATWDESVQRMKVDDINDPSIAIGWADDQTLHACLGVAGAPIPQGANEAASGAALRAWFSGLVVAVNVDSPVMLAGGIRSSEFFHHLSMADYGAIADELHSDPMLAWGCALADGGLSAGRLYVVTASGRGMNHAKPLRFVPFMG